MPRLINVKTLATAFGVVSLIVTACGGGASPTSTASPPPATVRSASSDIVRGAQRFVFSLFDADGAAYGPADVSLRLYHLDGENPEAVRSEVPARYLGAGTSAAQGLYSARINLDRTGGWKVEAVIQQPGREVLVTSTGIRAKARSDAPSPGDPAPATENLTLADAPIEQLTSQRPPGDPDLYRVTIAEALRQGRPLVIVFSTPAFCETRRCGPQLEIAQALKQTYGGQVTFVHIEIFERPDLLLERGTDQRVRAEVREWNLLSEPWVFVIDEEGLVFDRLEGFSPKEELEASIRGVLDP